MILVDDRTGSKELLPYIQKLRIPCQLQRLEYGDACFEGHGPKGVMTIGVERKTLNDMLSCIEDARYAAHQRPGMAQCYSRSFLCLEGLWACGDGNGYDGLLMQGFRNGQAWGPLRQRGNRTTLFSKLYNYMLSISLTGVIVVYPSNISQTARYIGEIYHYFQKDWNRHTSMREVQKLAIPTMEFKPSLVREWASRLDGVGVVKSEDAERLFKTPYKLATSCEEDWLKIKGVGVATAQRIVKQIRGWK